MKFGRCVFALLLVSWVAQAQDTPSIEETFRKSAHDNKPVFLVFSGSDWCAPCIRFKARILTDPIFTEFADRNLLLVIADFPQRKRLPAEVINENESLAENYNPHGIFPLLVLLRPDRSVLSQLTYRDESADVFIGEMRSKIDYERAQGIQAPR